ncbi:two pore domain potassium channel family protein [Candidatus Woesearchaeota archaeon]|nr:two pore domain potassium channel family protein [Candidatus Woesearchaeota archaeon]
MQGKIPLREAKYHFLLKLIDRTSFFRIFFIWISIIVVFAGFYHVITLSSGENFLTDFHGNKITGFSDKVYYSFITATSTGYGDIIPRGTGMRVLAIFNVILGILMMAVVTSKLVSMKQEKLLEQIYHLSFSERVTKLLSGLALFRGEADALIEDIKRNPVDRKTLFSLKIRLSSLKLNMAEIREQIVDNHVGRISDAMQLEQTLIRISHVFDKLEEIVELMNQKDLTFKNPQLLEEIYIISNLGVQTVTKIKEDNPIYTNTADSVLKSIGSIKRNILQFKLINTDKEIEINVSPEVLESSEK